MSYQAFALGWRKRVVLSGGKKAVVDGPFTETKELIAGFWLWQVKSMESDSPAARRLLMAAAVPYANSRKGTCVTS